MLAESARAASAAEARFRLQEANSRPRTTTIVALDRPSEVLLGQLAARPWSHAMFLKDPRPDPGDPQAGDGWVTGMDGRPTRIRDRVDASDQVIMLATAGGHAAAVGVIGRACSRRRVTTTALIVTTEISSERDLSQTLAQLRPWSLMLVIAATDEFVSDMMTALRV